MIAESATFSRSLLHRERLDLGVDQSERLERFLANRDRAHVLSAVLEQELAHVALVEVDAHQRRRTVPVVDKALAMPPDRVHLGARAHLDHDQLRTWRGPGDPRFVSLLLV